ncbi:hypothetical protein PI126_g13613 [Phytophthora idaei]|nr:hypothetical protein PI126_g13613 [Phytophthora idaei]
MFQPEDWDKPQRVLVSAVDDVVSEVEYGGLYNGGPLLHYSEICLLLKEELHAGQTSVRVCDITNECAFAQAPVYM